MKKSGIASMKSADITRIAFSGVGFRGLGFRGFRFSGSGLMSTATLDRGPRNLLNTSSADGYLKRIKC